MSAAPLPTLMVVPTGIGCEIGGYAGDALPSARLLAAASGCLITHPNVMNGAALYWSDPRIHYVEGDGCRSEACCLSDGWDDETDVESQAFRCL